MQGHPGPRNGPVDGHQAAQRTARAGGLLGEQGVAAPEGRLVPANRPPGAGLHRGDLQGQVLPVQRVAHLGTQRVPSGQPAGTQLEALAGREERIPDRDRVLRRHHQLVAQLAGVAGAADRQLHPGQAGGGEAHVAVLGGQAEGGQQLRRARALHGQHRVRLVLVGDGDLLRRGGAQPAHDLGGVRGVRDEEDVVVGVQVGDDVVHHAAGRVVAAERVLRPTRTDPAQVVAEAGVDELGRAGAAHPGLAQVRHVEDPHRRTHRGVLLEHPAAGVLQRHLPAPEGGELGTESGVPLVQRGTAQPGLGGGGGHVGHGWQLTGGNAAG